MEDLRSLLEELPPIVGGHIVRLEVDFDKKVAVIVMTSTAPMSVRSPTSIPLDTRAKYMLSKIIVIQDNKFFYAKNRCGPTGEFIPTREEREEIVEILI